MFFRVAWETEEKFRVGLDEIQVLINMRSIRDFLKGTILCQELLPFLTEDLKAKGVEIHEDLFPLVADLLVVTRVTIAEFSFLLEALDVADGKVPHTEVGDVWQWIGVGHRHRGSWIGSAW